MYLDNDGIDIPTDGQEILPSSKGDGKIHVVGHRCPYCHVEVVKGEGEAQLCDQCFAVSHRDCWEEHQGCGACGAGVPICGVCGGKFNKDEVITTVISCMECPLVFHLQCSDLHNCQEKSKLLRPKGCSNCSSQLRFSSTSCELCDKQFCKDCFYEHRCEPAHKSALLVTSRQGDEELVAALDDWKKINACLACWEKRTLRSRGASICFGLLSVTLLILGVVIDSTQVQIASVVVMLVLASLSVLSIFCAYKEDQASEKWGEQEEYVARLRERGEIHEEGAEVEDQPLQAHKERA